MIPQANYPEAALEAARPFVESFLKRRGWKPRGSEADALTGYVLTMAAPFLRAQALEDAAEALELPGTDASGYYSGECHSGYTEAECHADTWLRARAATERGQG